MIFNRTKTYTFEEFFAEERNKVQSAKKIDYSFLNALFFLNPVANPQANPGPQVPVMPNFDFSTVTDTIKNNTDGMMSSIDKLTESLNGFSQADGFGKIANMAHLICNPMEFLKIIAQVMLDLSFSTSVVVTVIALCMFVFTGCKDKSSLKYVGLAVSCMFLFSVILNAFIVTI